MKPISLRTAVPARVPEDEVFRPIVMLVGGEILTVESIDERVEEEDDWWEPNSAFKMHYQVIVFARNP